MVARIKEEERRYSPYSPPENVFRTNDKEVWSWAYHNLDRGKNILRLEPAWPYAEICSQILLGRDRIRRVSGLSTLVIRKLRRMLREQVAIQSNIRPRWGYKTPSKDEEKKSIALKFTKLLDYWWTMAFTDRQFRGTVQYSGGGGTGYLELGVDNNFDGVAGNVQIAATPLDYRQLIPFHRMENWNIQKLFSVAIWHEMDVAEAREKYPWAKDIIRADRLIPSGMAKGRQANSTGVFRGVVDWMRRKRGKVVEGSSPTCDVFCIYVRDKSINTSGDSITMGDAEWEYEVKSYYSRNETKFQDSTGRYITEIETGEMENVDGIQTPKTRRVSMEECMFYPTRRNIIICSGGVIFDSGARNLHGRLPVGQFKLDDVEGQLLGFPIIMDAKPAVDSMNAILRTIEDSIHSKANPDFAIDNKVPPDVKAALQRPKIWRSRVFQYSISTLAKAIQVLVPPEYYNVDSNAYELVKYLNDQADYQAGTKDTQNFAKLKQLPAGDTVEALLQASGDLPVDQSRNIESGLMQLGPIFLGLMLQVYNTRRLIEIIGGSEIAEFLDFNPTDLVPLESKTDNRPRWLRAREFMQQFPFYASPNSLHERQSMTQQLKRLQAKNAGVQISSRRIFDAMFPEDDFDENMNEWEDEQRRVLKIMADLQAYKSQLDQSMQMGNAIASLLGGSASAATGNGKEGRPPTNQAPATQETKTTESGIPRVTTATS